MATLSGYFLVSAENFTTMILNTPAISYNLNHQQFATSTATAYFTLLYKTCIFFSQAWSYPSYEFSYKVSDPHTHDHKGQHEVRDGDVVRGEYWLIEPDGNKRTVKYHADGKSGYVSSLYKHILIQAGFNVTIRLLIRQCSKVSLFLECLSVDGGW